jgi:hypothetical protein
VDWPVNSWRMFRVANTTFIPEVGKISVLPGKWQNEGPVDCECHECSSGLSGQPPAKNLYCTSEVQSWATLAAVSGLVRTFRRKSLFQVFGEGEILSRATSRSVCRITDRVSIAV